MLLGPMQSSSRKRGTAFLEVAILDLASPTVAFVWLACSHAQLVQADGMANTKVVVKGPGPAGFTALAF